jgi:membrane protein DedA with SNARE-associated domain
VHEHFFSFAVHTDLHHVVHHRFTGPHVDYIGVGLAAVASWIGVSGPGEAALIAAGIAAAHHKVDIGSMVLVAWVGAAVGGMAGWLVGLRGGRPLMTVRGPLYEMRLRLLRHGDRLYGRYGLLAVYFAPSWMAGINGMRAGRFLPANAIAALIWALSVGLGAFFAGPPIVDVLGDIGVLGIAALVLLGAVTIVVARRRGRRLRPPDT